MTTLDTAQALYRAFAAKDGPAMLALLHPDIIWVQNHGFPGGAPHRGAEHILTNVLSQFSRDWTGFAARVTEWHASGDTAFAIGAYHGTYNATRLALDPPAAFTHVLTVDKGRVVRFRQFTDTALIRRAMGLPA